MQRSYRVKKADIWRLSAFEVTKYNPKYRNKEGHFLNDDWTDFSDIGKYFNDIKLTYSDYLKVEDKYIEAIKYLFEYYNTEKIQFVSRRFYRKESELNYLKNIELQLIYNVLKNRRTLNLNETLLACRLALRGALSGEFIKKNCNEIGVRFGFDYYMYFNTPNNAQEIQSYISSIGLFIGR